MTEKKSRRFHLIYGLCLTLLIFAVGICFIVSCIDIYHSGSMPFSPESISLHFSRIAIPVYLCLVAILGGIILHIALPLDEEKPKAFVTEKVILKKLYKKIDVKDCSPECQGVIKSQRGYRIAFLIVVICNLIIHLASALLYVLDMNNFSAEDINGEVLNGTLTLIKHSFIPFFACLIYLIFERFTIIKELEAVKLSISKNAKNGITVSLNEPKASFFKKHKSIIINIARALLIALAVAFIILGIFNDGMYNVLQKAIKICTECIGLG